MHIGSRLLCGLVAGAVVSVGIASPASAATVAAPGGVGSTFTKATVLSVRLGQNGSLLDLEVLGDTGTASNDPHLARPEAASSLLPLSLRSDLLHLNLATPALATQAPGGPSDAAGQSIDLAALGAPPALVTGILEAAALHSAVGTAGAHSSMNQAEVRNITVAGGSVLSLDLLSSTLGADAITSDATGARAVNVGTLKLLDLGALLKGLGIDLGALPLSTVSQLLARLGTGVPGVPAGLSLASFAGQLTSSLTVLRGTLNAPETQVVGTVDAATQSLLGSLGVPVPSLSSTVAQVNTVMDQVQAKLVALLNGGLSALDSFPLIQLAATQVGIDTKAASTLANSAALISSAPLKITVAGVALPVLDATTLVGTVNNAVGMANAALNSLVGSLGLPANLISLSLLDQSKSLGMSGKYTQAVAGITGLTAKIAPIDASLITGALAKLGGPSVTSLLGGTASPSALPLSAAMSALGSLLHLTAPLTGGVVVQVASVGGLSTYVAAAPTASSVSASPAAPAATQTLPFTGGRATWTLLGLLLFVASLAAVRLRRLSSARG